MSKLEIKEQQGKFFVCYYLRGELNKSTMAALDSYLRILLESNEPEFILIECQEVTNIGQEAITQLRKMAFLFGEQARELAICQVASSLYTDIVFEPPLNYYNNYEQALNVFRESMPAERHSQSSSLLPQQSPILKLIALCKDGQPVAYVKNKQEVVIGRHSKCNLSLPQNIQISRFHCKCYEKDGKFFLEDLGNSNGTVFNNDFIDGPLELLDGYKFQIGDTWVKTHIYYDNQAKSLVESNLLPLVDIPEPVVQEENPMDLKMPEKNSDGDALETKFGVTFSQLLAEEEETVRLKVDTNRLANLYSQHVLGDTKEDQKKDNDFLYNFRKSSTVPTLMVKKSSVPPQNEIIENRYQILEVIGESNTTFILNAMDVVDATPVYIHYAKEPMFLHVLQHRHPHLLIDIAHGEHKGRWFRVLCGPVLPLQELPLAEVQVLEIGIALCDLLHSLHSTGKNGFDIDPGNVLYGPNSLPVFALVPAVIYNEIIGEKADIFSVGRLFYKLLSGEDIPYSPMGDVENEKIAEDLQQRGISPSLTQIIMEVIHSNLQDIMEMNERLKKIWLQMVAPTTSQAKSINLNMAKVEKTVISQYSTKPMRKFPWPDNILSLCSSHFITPLSQDNLKNLGQTIYDEFFPKDFSSTLIQQEIRNVELSLDQELVSIPWEVVHDGNHFLSEKYCLTRNIVDIPSQEIIPPLFSPKIFILADVAPWAQECKNILLGSLQENGDNAQVEACDTSESPINIVQKMFHCDIFHVIGSVGYHSSDPMDSGWILSPRKNLFKVRILQNAPRKPSLVFYQGKMKSLVDTHNFLMYLYQLGISHTVGTLWSVKKPELAAVFYRYFLRGMDIREAIFHTRQNFIDQPYTAMSLFSYGSGSFSTIAPGV